MSPIRTDCSTKNITTKRDLLSTRFRRKKDISSWAKIFLEISGQDKVENSSLASLYQRHTMSTARSFLITAGQFRNYYDVATSIMQVTLKDLFYYRSTRGSKTRNRLNGCLQILQVPKYLT